ncbi:rCG54701, isoform CRA_b [Rattus norvegicus]|uniref:RCG54701, isoform CRA_b n=1 Tax=Rattus norvegicus TaxID=10116 RepID=A6KFN2_RAT|nr:rCG54701, isoform CRA_b [Rattus norvegicus]EDL75975.1 rCG54701, isoform CRA_b [Rattus norvegicus]
MVSYSTRRFRCYPAILGSEGDSLDRQYWDVNAEHKFEWLLGVCREPFPGHGNDERLSVQDGLWGVGLNDLANYVALGHEKNQSSVQSST